MLGLCSCAGFSVVAGGYSLVAEHRLLIVVACWLVVEQRL